LYSVPNSILLCINFVFLQCIRMKFLCSWIKETIGCFTAPFEIYLTCVLFYFVPQNFYMIGRDKSRTYWRVLKIDRLDPSELNVLEDSATYTEKECSDLLRRIHEGNKSTGGLKFVTTCYGIVGMYIHNALFSYMLTNYQLLSWNVWYLMLFCF
jgi:hypothetical protein